MYAARGRLLPAVEAVWPQADTRGNEVAYKDEEDGAVALSMARIEFTSVTLPRECNFDQHFHRDAQHLFHRVGATPPRQLTVVLAPRDVTPREATEFLAQTHLYTGDLDHLVRATGGDAGPHCSQTPDAGIVLFSVPLQATDALIFDDRMVHRGVGRRGGAAAGVPQDEDRDLLYLTVRGVPDARFYSGT